MARVCRVRKGWFGFLFYRFEKGAERSAIRVLLGTGLLILFTHDIDFSLIASSLHPECMRD